MLLYTNLLFSQVPSKIVDALHVEGNEFYYLYHLSDSGDYYADQRKIVRSSFPEDAIDLGWDEGYYITDLSYGNSYWSLIMTKKTSNQTAQRWSTITDTEKIHEKVKKGYDEGYYITDISYGDGAWVLIMTKLKSVGGESFSTVYSIDEFSKKTKEKWDEGYDILEVAHGNGAWAVVYRKKLGYNNQTWFGRDEFPVDKIKQELNKGKVLTSFDWNSDFSYSIGVMANVPNYTSQSLDDLATTNKIGKNNPVITPSKPKPKPKPKPKVKKEPPKGVKID